MTSAEKYVRGASVSDLERIMGIYRIAQDRMIASGNPLQWGHFYPSEAVIREDIENGNCRVISVRDGSEEAIHGVFAFCEGTEPTYARIDGGEWLNDGPYAAIHRIAGDGEVKGIFDTALRYCRSRSDNLRIDTHQDNRIMQKLIERNGFVRCGTIYVEDGSPRIAYQWIREKERKITG